MSGKKPREALQDAEFEGYRDRQLPFGIWFLSVFVWALLGLSMVLRVGPAWVRCGRREELFLSGLALA